FVGTAVALAYLEAGYTVRGTCRSHSKAEQWISLFPRYKSKFEYAVVEDIATPGCFDDPVKGVEIIAHTASPFTYIIKDNEKDLLLPAIAGTHNLLSATSLSITLKRVVLTSSFASVFDFATFPAKGKTYTDDDWNPATYEEAKTHAHPGYVYCASKVLAERTFWEWIERERPRWEGSVVCPPNIYGPPHQPLTSLDSLNTSTQDVWNIMSGAYKEGLPPTAMPASVDVRDVALAHVRASEREEAKGQRYLLIGGVYTNEEIASIIAQSHPELSDRLPKVDDLSKIKHDLLYNSSKAQEQLGIQFIPLEKCIKDTADKLVQIERELKN
ncbi:flavonol reductase, partial [Stereum hirsutum FP-91666 SS1]|uniref:flavonol reductase n=1 Tax=Stereum hirsutum (strain FP-91666) TaxID=721885 RepID=UPI000440E733